MQILKTVKHIVDLVISWFCIALLAIMTCLVTYQVFTRMVLNNPSAISEILAQYMFVWLVMLGSAYVFGLREHLSITLLKDKVPAVINMVIEILISLLLISFSVGVTITGGLEQTMSQMKTTDASLLIPMGTIYSVIPLTGAFMIFYALYNIILAVDEFKNHSARKSDDTAGTM